MQIFKQRRTGTFIGIAKILVAQVSPYVSWLSLALVGIMSFYTTISPIFAGWGIQLPFWMFLVAIAVFVLIVVIVEWVFMMPSFYGAGNIQAWECENPQRELMEKMEADIIEARREIKELRNILLSRESDNADMD